VVRCSLSPEDRFLLSDPAQTVLQDLSVSRAGHRS
jgi:hypothetical protein